MAGGRGVTDVDSGGEFTGVDANGETTELCTPDWAPLLEACAFARRDMAADDDNDDEDDEDEDELTLSTCTGEFGFTGEGLLWSFVAG